MAPHGRGQSSLRSRSRGFTLIELTISLVAGLIVAMAVMGVSREATNTFHEEVRISSAEMGLRIAMERIRLDLQRAAYMGTANILGDPNIAHIANAPAPSNLSNYSGTVPYSLLNLSGVNVFPSGATTGGVGVPQVIQADTAGMAAENLQAAGAAPLLATLPSMATLSPDAIDIAGNMASADEYPASVIWGPPLGPPIPGVPSGCSPTAALSIQMTSPSGWRIRNAESLGSTGTTGYQWGTALQAIFHPGANQSSSFLLKVTDQSGLAQYVVGCGGQLNAATYQPQGGGAGNLPVATLFLAAGSTLVPASQTGGHGGIAGFSAGLVTVSPLQVTRWAIMTPLQVYNAVAGASLPLSYFFTQTSFASTDPTDFFLTRSYVDVSSGACGTSKTPCPPDPFTIEVISEYAVDLKVGLTVDTVPNPKCTGPTAFPCPTATPSYTAYTLVNIPMDSGAAAFADYGSANGTYSGGLGPQRVRDVQVRLGIRSPFGDRAASLQVPTDSAIPNGYLYRYLMSPTAAHYTPATPYARVREATTEVNLPNQSRVYW